MAGNKPAEYKGVAKFFTFLSSPEIQADWHQKTGYVPITKAAYELTKKQGFYEKNPGTDVAIQQFAAEEPDQGLQRHTPGQLRADPRHHRRGAGIGMESEEVAETGAGRRSPARQRRVAQVRARQQGWRK